MNSVVLFMHLGDGIIGVRVRIGYGNGYIIYMQGYKDVMHDLW